MKKVIVFITWRCGLKCPYCKYEIQKDKLSVKFPDSGRIQSVERELSVEEWLNILSSYKEFLIEFSGGEPLKYSGIEDLLNNLPQWAMTSNTLGDISKINLKKCYSWTASFHPHISEDMMDLFIHNAHKIRDKAKHFSITLVAQPNTVLEIKRWADKFYGLGFNVNIHPYYEANFSWYNYPKELSELKTSKFIRYKDLMFEFKGMECENCKGGSEYFVFSPDGKRFSCFTEMIFGKCEKISYYPCDWDFRN